MAAVAVVLVTAGCGSTTHFADRDRPPTTLDDTVYINNARISVAPDHFGAGPVLFLVTNGATHTESLTLTEAGSSRTLARTAPINPGLTAQFQVDFTHSGTVTVSTSGSSVLTSIRPATLHIGKQRAPANNALLQP